MMNIYFVFFFYIYQRYF